MNFMVGFLVNTAENNGVPMFSVSLQCVNYELAVVARDYMASLQPDRNWFVVQIQG